MEREKVVVGPAGVCITDLDVPSKDVADFLRDRQPDERVELLIRSLEVGVFCLERAQTAQDTEFVKRQIQILLTDVGDAVKGIPSATQEALLQRIGSDRGQVLEPVATLVTQVSQSMTERVREVQSLLSDDIDPTKESSVLGAALKKIRDLLDPQRTDSIQGALRSAVESATSDTGTLAKAVGAAADNAIKPLADRVAELAREIRGQEEAAEALDRTTAKGAPYEEEVVVALQRWASIAGGEVHHVGGDNKPGDVLIQLTDCEAAGLASIVVEAKYRESRKGRKQVTDEVRKAMAERGAGAAVFVSCTSDGFAKEIGEWAEGECEHGRFVACTHDHLITAIRFLIVQERLAALRAASPEVDSSSIGGQIQRVRTSLARVTNINRKVTDVRSGVDAIQTEAEAIRDEIRSALAEIEEALRSRLHEKSEP